MHVRHIQDHSCTTIQKIAEWLTFGSPHRFHNMKLNHEHHSSNNDCSQGCLWNVIEIWSEKLEGEDHNETCNKFERNITVNKLIPCSRYWISFIMRIQSAELRNSYMKSKSEPMWHLLKNKQEFKAKGVWITYRCRHHQMLFQHHWHGLQLHVTVSQTLAWNWQRRTECCTCLLQSFPGLHLWPFLPLQQNKHDTEVYLILNLQLLWDMTLLSQKYFPTF